MKKICILLLAASLCLAACGKAPASGQAPQEAPGTEATETTPREEMEWENVEIVGPWHLDSERNDLAAFADSLELFPGYGEWGAGMEIRSNGQMSWYIGAEGGHGTYTRDGDVLHAQLTSDLEQATQSWTFRVTREGNTTGLEMPYKDMTIYWEYGDQENLPGKE